jgi:5-deoxy-glucuronate isomerase
MIYHVAPQPNKTCPIDVSPASVGWKYISFRVAALADGKTLEANAGHEEMAFVPLSGAAVVEFDGQRHTLKRRDVWSELPHVLYLPPGMSYRILAQSAFEVAIGGAPAEGHFPPRLIRPDEIKTFVRGDANVRRGVSVLLDGELPAERLTLFEIYTPSGNWSSWPPHRHDGFMGSSDQEETYYYRLKPESGFAIQCMYAEDKRLNERVLARDGDLVLAHEGYHGVVTAPGTNAYYLNVLAGEVRKISGYEDPTFQWVRDNWQGNPIAIPLSINKLSNP